ncbi:MAG: AAA family ATPase [Acidimicrobiaceae bacterium]|nr:AAA family ATPase [Acidimicrobiaceae bacterium]
MDEFCAVFEAVVDNVSRVLLGKRDAIGLALVCLASEGHLLVEDVPGVGKTTLAKALAHSFDLSWQRIQFTPDLLPSDVTGVNLYDQTSRTFTFRPGPVFSNVLLGDEINRASPKTQSALLEAMEERQVTADGSTYPLPAPFLVIATQNPVEHEGTYPLPESQLDRFLLRIRLGYPDRQAELAMLDAEPGLGSVDELPVVAGSEAIATLIQLAARVHVAAPLKEYIIDVAAETRRHPALDLGMSPRAALGLLRAARALAASRGRDFVIPDDIKALFGPVLAHRLVLSPEAGRGEARAEEIVAEIVRSVPVP